MLADVGRWTEWTTAFAVVQLQQPPPLASGDEVFTKQQRLPGTIWTVTAVKPGVGFTWQAAGPGWAAILDVGLQPVGERRVLVTVSADERGVLGRVLRSRSVVFGHVERFAADLATRCARAAA